VRTPLNETLRLEAFRLDDYTVIDGQPGFIVLTMQSPVKANIDDLDQIN
jgi:hypothetical protein